ncbi:hypothetical protein [Streptomyces sp. NPDC088115]|uniref:hypothetical protein n=1 Tax=Streptomyces sp. NPDC088115 TaxID=3365824 RepID=UPI00380A13B7
MPSSVVRLYADTPAGTIAAHRREVAFIADSPLPGLESAMVERTPALTGGVAWW